MILRNADAIEFLNAFPDASMDLILTDPPYDRAHQHLYGLMAEAASRKLKVGGSLVTLCGHYNAIEVGADMSKHLRFWWLCGMLHDTLQRLPGKWVCVQGKPALWFVRERRKKGDTSCPVDFQRGKKKDKRYHAWGQPVGWFAHWIARLTGPGDVVVDPFLGGGTTGVAALALRRRFYGSEQDPGHYATALERLARVEKAMKRRAQRGVAISESG